MEKHSLEWIEVFSEGRRSFKCKIVKVVQSLHSPTDLALLGADGQFWLSHDCGSTATEVGQDYLFLKVKFHPATSKTMIALAKSQCNKSSSSTESEDKLCATRTKLLYSEDDGDTFKVLRTQVIQFDWLKSRRYLSAPGVDAIVSTEYDLKFGPQPTKTPQRPQGVSLYFSWDLFETQTRIVDGGYRYWLSSRTMFVETADRKGRISLHCTEIYQNAFNWRPVNLHGRLPASEYKQLIPITDLQGAEVDP